MQSDIQKQDKSSDIEQQPPFGDRKISNIRPQNKLQFKGVINNHLNISTSSIFFIFYYNSLLYIFYSIYEYKENWTTRFLTVGVQKDPIFAIFEHRF